VWSKNLSNKEWEQQAHVKFIPNSSSAGEWKKIKEMPDRWQISYQLQTSNFKLQPLKFRLGLTAFKHVGAFPEQAVNWNYIFDSIKAIDVEQPKVLNLFAYTGGASLAAKAAGADVTHLDSIKQVVTWAKENMQLTGLKDIRWIVEDAMTYVKREVKRGKKYHGIILDPPAYGHGTDGQKWKLEDQINEMMEMIFKLLEEKYFLILNTYSLGFSSLIIENIFKSYTKDKFETGELYLQSTTDQKLPLGVFGRQFIG
jgi:23S rRNA (cytosine1962-C5)-methyltransferase